MEALGVILTGGESTRMGRDKSSVVVGGRSMFDWVTAALNAAGLEVVVAGPPRPDSAVRTIPDAVGRGPVAGLVAVLEAVPGRDLFLAAVDQPLLQPETVEMLLAIDGTVVAPVDNQVPQVTTAVYRPEVLHSAHEVLMSERASLWAVAEAAGATLIPERVWRSWGEDGRSWLGVDSPEDVATAEARLDADGPGLRSSP